MLCDGVTWLEIENFQLHFGTLCTKTHICIIWDEVLSTKLLKWICTRKCLGNFNANAHQIHHLKNSFVGIFILRKIQFIWVFLSHFPFCLPISLIIFLFLWQNTFMKVTTICESLLNPGRTRLSAVSDLSKCSRRRFPANQFFCITFHKCLTCISPRSDMKVTFTVGELNSTSLPWTQSELCKSFEF